MLQAVWELLLKGGLMSIPILLASAWGLTIYFERLWVLTPERVVPMHLKKQLMALVEQDKIQEALVLSESSETPYGKIMCQILAKAGRAYPYLKETAEDAGKVQLDFLERRIGSLSTVVAISPLMGLLGTVLGMITVFQAVAEKGVGSPMDMAAGIWEALLSTAFGLSVAIVALVGHRHLSARVDGFVTNLEKDAVNLVEALDVLNLSETTDEKTSQNESE